MSRQIKVKYIKNKQRVYVRSGLFVAIERWNDAFEQWAREVNKTLIRLEGQE